MKYKLKKDLPMAKAGQEIHIVEQSNNYCFNMEIWDDAVVRIWYSDLGKLIADGWIEEVKPREWYCLLNTFNNVIGYGNVNKTICKDFAEKELRKENRTIIKVTEVL